MDLRKIAVRAALVVGCSSAVVEAAERPKVVREAMTIESHRMVHSDSGTGLHPNKRVSRLMPVDVAVYRPNDGLKHPAVVYLHGGGMSFADPVMDRFHTELASRGLVVLAPHYLLDGTGWPHWHESAVNTVTLAASLPSVDADHIGMAGLSMGGQIGLSTAARDPRIKAVAEFFTAWPGSLPDEPIAKLPPVLLLNGTADPIIPFHLAMDLDEILKEHKLPYERHVYEGLGHGLATPASFRDAVHRTTAFFGGNADEPSPTRGTSPSVPLVAFDASLGEDDEELDESNDLQLFPTSLNTAFGFPIPKRRPRLVVKKSRPTRTVASPTRSANP